MFRDLNVTDPSELTENAVLQWCAGNGKPLANNSVRARTVCVTSFLRWCAKHGIPTVNAAILTDPDSPLRQYRPTYGKVQAHHPARWLTHDEAFTQLLAACHADTETLLGLRDEIIIRLGLAGLRVSEIGALTVGAIDLRTPLIQFTGKGYKPRQIVPGPQLVAALARYLDHYTAGLNQPPARTQPLICRRRNGRWAPGNTQLQWGTPFSEPRDSIAQMLAKRSHTANLGHVAPHDLRRTAAGILHRSTSADGGHLFDLLDIQKVLDHADPATTMRSYLDPMDTGVKARAGTVLD